MLSPSVLISRTIAHAPRGGSTERQPSTRPYNGRLSSLQHPQASHKQPISASQGDPSEAQRRASLLPCYGVVNAFFECVFCIAFCCYRPGAVPLPLYYSCFCFAFGLVLSLHVFRRVHKKLPLPPLACHFFLLFLLSFNALSFHASGLYSLISFLVFYVYIFFSSLSFLSFYSEGGFPLSSLFAFVFSHIRLCQ